MSEVVDLNTRRSPVIYDVTIAQHYDGTVEFSIHNVADDPRSKDAVLWAFRRISGADERIDELEAALREIAATSKIMAKGEDMEIALKVMLSSHRNTAIAALAGEKKE